MKTFFNALGAIGGWVLGLLLTASWVLGSLHAEKKHDEGYLPWVIMPWGMYRGIEQFWHDDYKGINWETKLEGDLNAAIYLLTEASYKEADMVKINSGVQELSDKINNYPKDKIDYLMNGCRSYYKYSIYSSHDVVPAMFHYYEDGEISVQYSDSTMLYKGKLINDYKMKDAVTFIDSSVSVLISTMKDNPITDSAELRNVKKRFKDAIDLSFIRTENAMKHTFKQIFNKEL